MISFWLTDVSKPTSVVLLRRIARHFADVHGFNLGQLTTLLEESFGVVSPNGVIKEIEGKFFHEAVKALEIGRKRSIEELYSSFGIARMTYVSWKSNTTRALPGDDKLEKLISFYGDEEGFDREELKRALRLSIDKTRQALIAQNGFSSLGVLPIGGFLFKWSTLKGLLVSILLALPSLWWGVLFLSVLGLAFLDFRLLNRSLKSSLVDQNQYLKEKTDKDKWYVQDIKRWVGFGRVFGF